MDSSMITPIISALIAAGTATLIARGGWRKDKKISEDSHSLKLIEETRAHSKELYDRTETQLIAALNKVDSLEARVDKIKEEFSAAKEAWDNEAQSFRNEIKELKNRLISN